MRCMFHVSSVGVVFMRPPPLAARLLVACGLGGHLGCANRFRWAKTTHPSAAWPSGALAGLPNLGACVRELVPLPAVPGRLRGSHRRGCGGRMMREPRLECQALHQRVERTSSRPCTSARPCTSSLGPGHVTIGAGQKRILQAQAMCFRAQAQASNQSLQPQTSNLSFL